VVNLLLYLAAGRLITWLLQTSGLLRPLWDRHPILTELAECDLCLGFWVYLALAVTWGVTPLGLWPVPVEWVLLAAGSAFTAHLLRLGWWAKFGTVVIE
jgi:hypothetical protein